MESGFELHGAARSRAPVYSVHCRQRDRNGDHDVQRVAARIYWNANGRLRLRPVPPASGLAPRRRRATRCAHPQADRLSARRLSDRPMGVSAATRKPISRSARSAWGQGSARVNGSRRTAPTDVLTALRYHGSPDVGSNTMPSAPSADRAPKHAADVVRIADAFEDDQVRGVSEARERHSLDGAPRERQTAAVKVEAGDAGDDCLAGDVDDDARTVRTPQARHVPPASAEWSRCRSRRA